MMSDRRSLVKKSWRLFRVQFLKYGWLGGQPDLAWRYAKTQGNLTGRNLLRKVGRAKHNALSSAQIQAMSSEIEDRGFTQVPINQRGAKLAEAIGKKFSRLIQNPANVEKMDPDRLNTFAYGKCHFVLNDPLDRLPELALFVEKYCGDVLREVFQSDYILGGAEVCRKSPVTEDFANKEAFSNH